MVTHEQYLQRVEDEAFSKHPSDKVASIVHFYEQYLQSPLDFNRRLFARLS
jgi:hypothetical protein